jgi:hypothetical protein
MRRVATRSKDKSDLSWPIYIVALGMAGIALAVVILETKSSMLYEPNVSTTS